MNDYEVIGQIGEGAFGKAFLVQDRRQENGACRCVVKEVDLRKVVSPLTLLTSSSGSSSFDGKPTSCCMTPW